MALAPLLALEFQTPRTPTSSNVAPRFATMDGIEGMLDDIFQTPTSLNTPTHSSEVDESEESDSDDEPGTRNSSKSPRATLRNPFHGLVEGVKRGNAKCGTCHLQNKCPISVLYGNTARHSPAEATTSKLRRRCHIHPAVQPCDAGPYPSRK